MVADVLCILCWCGVLCAAGVQTHDSWCLVHIVLMWGFMCCRCPNTWWLMSCAYCVDVGFYVLQVSKHMMADVMCILCWCGVLCAAGVETHDGWCLVHIVLTWCFVCCRCLKKGMIFGVLWIVFWYWCLVCCRCDTVFCVLQVSKHRHDIWCFVGRVLILVFGVLQVWYSVLCAAGV